MHCVGGRRSQWQQKRVKLVISKWRALGSECDRTRGTAAGRHDVDAVIVEERATNSLKQGGEGRGGEGSDGEGGDETVPNNEQQKLISRITGYSCIVRFLILFDTRVCGFFSFFQRRHN